LSEQRESDEPRIYISQFHGDKTWHTDSTDFPLVRSFC
jgi:hypothetical protein